jgi:hypothetical protein
MKPTFFLHLVFLLVGITNSFAQATKPTIMILPSDNWCDQRFFTTEINNQGTKQKVPNYKQAFQEDTELGQVISKIGSLMIDRGFPLKDVEQQLKSIETKNAEDNMTNSKSGASIDENPLDVLKKRAKADILIQIWWKVNKTDNGKVVSFVLEAFDSYTNKRIAAASGNSNPSSTEIVPEILQKAIVSNIDLFNTQLMAHFTDLLENGREILLTVKRWDSWDKDFEYEIDGEELTDYINKWMNQNTVKKKFNRTEASENKIEFEQVRIPLNDSEGNPIDAREFAKGLQKYLKKEPFNFEVKLMQRGLGEAILIVGEK